MTDTIFRAARIITMGHDTPFATHLRVRDGRVLAVGDERAVRAWEGPAELDESLDGRIVLPGFVEGHAHMMAGAMWRYTYLGHYARTAPDGTPWPGVPTTEAVIERLKQAAAEAPGDAPLVAWGFDPIFLEGRRLDRHHLDQVSQTRPIAVIHSNFHLLTANTPALRAAGYERGTNVEGVVLEEDGEPAGELQEMAAMFPVMRRLRIDMGALGREPDDIRAYGQVARLAGATTVTDLFSELTDADASTLLDVTGDDAFPARIVPALNALTGEPDEIVRRSLALRERSSAKLRLGAVKLMTDGAIQGWTARIKWPGYFTGTDQGTWNLPPERLDHVVETLHAAGLHMHMHVNGDEAVEVGLDAFEKAFRRHPRADHRHVLQHAQLATAAHFRRMAALGLCCNLFANHVHYFGDIHHARTIGPDRARRMDACRTALDEGVRLAIHSDAPVTPLGPLTTAWAAVTRLTEKGMVLGEEQRITVAEALRLITLGAAYTLHMDDEIGSIECGKRADFAVLADDPLEVAPEGLRDIEVVGTVLDGRVTA